jgi:DNA-binding IclR family transcriptional regulator
MPVRRGKILLADIPVERVRELLLEKLEAFTPRTIVDRETLFAGDQRSPRAGLFVIDNELEEELLSLSRPVRDAAGALVAVLTVDGPRYRFGRSRIPSALHSMQTTAERIAELLWHAEESDAPSRKRYLISALQEHPVRAGHEARGPHVAGQRFSG